MRKVYLLRENEEDGALLDAMEAAGLTPDESALCNPDCPRCSSETLLAYSEGDSYEVVTWDSIEEHAVAQADGWYLICTNFECEWEEQVERVKEPMGALIFDLSHSSFMVEEETGILTRSPLEQRELIAYLKELQQSRKHRKLQSFIEEAEWRYKDELTRIRRWLKRVPDGRLVEITVGADKFRGRLLATTDDGCMLAQESDGQIVAIAAESMDNYWPRRFDQYGPTEEDVRNTLDRNPNEPREWITVHCGRGRVVVQGQVLTLRDVDRLGQYHVGTWDEAPAKALGLKQVAASYWEGRFRRSDITERYEVREMIKARGFWFAVSGHTSKNHPHVSTEDPEAARAFGFKQVRHFLTDEEQSVSLWNTIPYWSGSIHPDEIEETCEVKAYYWPLPELQTADDERQR
ncbi:MAG TPA: hypothetical protein VK464_07375 [Symbiobacteriaceae bacterium]|jgi:hypothetical protein|nr:hypothetical protein [Symbiobacteriaceae bacterium]